MLLFIFRLEKAREEAAQPAHEKALARQEAHKWVQQINLHASQVADTRPVAYCEFSSDSQHIGNYISILGFTKYIHFQLLLAGLDQLQSGNVNSVPKK